MVAELADFSTTVVRCVPKKSVIQRIFQFNAKVVDCTVQRHLPGRTGSRTVLPYKRVKGSPILSVFRAKPLFALKWAKKLTVISTLSGALRETPYIEIQADSLTVFYRTGHIGRYHFSPVRGWLLTPSAGPSVTGRDPFRSPSRNRLSGALLQR